MTKLAIITGASSGIGQALTICLANAGYDVIAIGRNEVALQRTKSLTNHGKVSLVVADLSEEAEIDKVALNIDAQRKITFLIHCAGTTEPHLPLTKITQADLKKTINVNVMAPIFLTQQLAPNFEANTRVLFIGSDYVGVTNKMRPHIAGSYGISKSALRVAVEYFRHEYKDTALIGYLNPGSTDTPMFSAMKTAVLSQQGVFNHTATPASPANVAEFIQSVLEKSSSEDYCGIDWDFRDSKQREHVRGEKTTIPVAKL